MQGWLGGGIQDWRWAQSRSGFGAEDGQRQGLILTKSRSAFCSFAFCLVVCCYAFALLLCCSALCFVAVLLLIDKVFCCRVCVSLGVVELRHCANVSLKRSSHNDFETVFLFLSSCLCDHRPVPLPNSQRRRRWLRRCWCAVPFWSVSSVPSSEDHISDVSHKIYVYILF